MELYFLGCRYGHLTSNITESLNSWLLQVHEKPILAMFEQICHQLMSWFTERHTLEDKTLRLLVAKSSETLQAITNNRVHRYHSIPSIPGVLYEIISNETRHNYVINLEKHQCTCLI